MTSMLPTVPRRILWLGPMQPEQRMIRSSAATPAATRWSTGFLGGLEANGVACLHVGHEPARTWPWGPLRSAARDRSQARAAVGVAFTNVPGIRSRSLERAYATAVRRALSSFDPELVVTYNAEPHHAASISLAAMAGVPWVPIVLDAPDPDDGWTNISRMVDGAAGVAFLSYWASVNCPFSDCLHLDGGITAHDAPDTSDERRPIVLYTGAKGPWAGMDLLLEAWPLVRHPSARLWVCGQGRHAGLGVAAARDPRITDFGVVKESRLRELTEQASVLVNPRSPDYPGNRMNFPSKVLDYLGTGKPVVTTRTAGLAPEYDRVLIFAEPATPAALAAALDGVLEWPAERRESQRIAVRRFVAEHGDWRQVTARFLRWASDRRRRGPQAGMPTSVQEPPGVAVGDRCSP